MQIKIFIILKFQKHFENYRKKSFHKYNTIFNQTEVSKTEKYNQCEYHQTTHFIL